MDPAAVDRRERHDDRLRRGSVNRLTIVCAATTTCEATTTGSTVSVRLRRVAAPPAGPPPRTRPPAPSSRPAAGPTTPIGSGCQRCRPKTLSTPSRAPSSTISGAPPGGFSSDGWNRNTTFPRRRLAPRREDPRGAHQDRHVAVVAAGVHRRRGSATGSRGRPSRPPAARPCRRGAPRSGPGRPPRRTPRSPVPPHARTSMPRDSRKARTTLDVRCSWNAELRVPVEVAPPVHQRSPRSRSTSAVERRRPCGPPRSAQRSIPADADSAPASPPA